LVEEDKTHILYSVFFFKSCRLWDNVENFRRGGKTQLTTSRLRMACWILNATNTRSEQANVILIVLDCNSGYKNAP